MQNIFKSYLPQLFLLFFLDPPHVLSTQILCTLYLFTVNWLQSVLLYFGCVAISHYEEPYTQRTRTNTP